MAPPHSSADAFAAIAEPRRREIIGTLAKSTEERDVSWLVHELGWPQPQVSKHLSVLREVGIVSVVRKGRRRMYSLNGKELHAVYEWVKSFERFWDLKLQRIKARAKDAQREAASKSDHDHSQGV